MPQFFDAMDRDDWKAKRRTESDFAFLNRSAEPWVERMRRLVQELADLHSDLANEEWIGRFRTDDDRHHNGALFELYVAELIVRQGFTLKRDPFDDSARGRHPDFLVLKDGTPAFVVECTLVDGRFIPHVDQQRVNPVLEKLDELDSTDFVGAAFIPRFGAQTPPISRVRNDLEAWLAKLDPDAVEAANSSDILESLPVWTWENHGWSIGFLTGTRQPDVRGDKTIPTHGAWSVGGAHEADVYIKIARALKQKASRYGRLEHLPYVIAVAVLGSSRCKRHIDKALFGGWMLTIHEKTGEQKSGRNGEGLWLGKNGPTHTRVSAVLAVQRFALFDLAKLTPTLWHNPWAARPLSPDLWQGPQIMANQDSNGLEERPGRTAAEILGLDPNWPEVQ